MRYRETRLPCGTEVAIAFGEEVRRARVINISSSGARVEGLGRLPRDTLVMLAHLGSRIAARVAWSNDRQAGLRFPVPLSAAEVAALRGVGGSPGGWVLSDGRSRFRELS